MKNLGEYFEHVRKRPGMYLGKNTISKLADHLSGYRMSFHMNNIQNASDDYFFDNFNNFIYKYYEVYNNSHWRDIILEQCNNNEELALNTFFELYDEFIKNTEPLNSKAKVLLLLKKITLNQSELKSIIGNKFDDTILEILELIEDNILTNKKSDYDYILEELSEELVNKPELKIILDAINDEIKTE